MPFLITSREEKRKRLKRVGRAGVISVLAVLLFSRSDTIVPMIALTVDKAAIKRKNGFPGGTSCTKNAGTNVTPVRLSGSAIWRIRTADLSLRSPRFRRVRPRWSYDIGNGTPGSNRVIYVRQIFPFDFPYYEQWSNY